MYNLNSKKPEEFINDQEIKKTIEFAIYNKNNKSLIEKILEKARKIKGLNHKEALILLLCEIKEKNLEIFELAKKIKNVIYGKRIVLFAPLYIANYCTNGCTYCPYCVNKKLINRKKLTQKEIEKETIALLNMGHKRIALETGEDKLNIPIEYVLNSIDTIYNTKCEKENQKIRRINVNIAATTIKNYKKLKEKNIGTYILFQETYNKELYEKFHPSGPKSNYNYHTTAMDRALKANLDDLGFGVLFGLADFKYDFTALLMHKEHTESVFNVGPHTISVPRIKPAKDVDLSNFKNLISDKTFLKIIACFRIAVPYTGIIVSTRESELIRKKALEVGVSQISAASLTSVGGYFKQQKTLNSAQFETTDKRSLNQVVEWLLKLNHIPSFCASCYKKERIGEKFINLSSSFKIKKFCNLNSLLTLKEYLNEYAPQKTKKIGEQVIENEIKKIKNKQTKTKLINNFKKVKSFF